MSDRRLVKSLCEHADRRGVVHPVRGGYRAHCLGCGTAGPLREDRASARRAISAWTGSLGWEGPRRDGARRDSGPRKAGPLRDGRAAVRGRGTAGR